MSESEYEIQQYAGGGGGGDGDGGGGGGGDGGIWGQIREPEEPGVNDPYMGDKKTPFNPEMFSKESIVVLQNYHIMYKVIILGDSGVGKSNLLLRWNTDSFADLPPTLQVEFYTKSFMVDGKIICGQFWDTAGQEKYRSLTRQYYNGANGVVIMYSVTDLPSFVSVAKWLTDLRNINEDAKVIIVGNKIDLNGKLRKIRDYGQEYAKSVQIPFLEISAKEGTNSMKALQLILQCIHVKDEIKEVEQEKVKPIDFTNFDSDDEIDDFGDKCTGCHVEPDNIW
eukprot:TRINITY_DN7424_c0_g1_i1.p1 TRINITY_DN7424_c0_g1~~TRINITY_DN7424_c0_g1_i1.p1  ORF type:complete len:281 (-),score=66.19 TRINITY_DN7424_c0_g1_i1:231-1073(-)